MFLQLEHKAEHQGRKVEEQKQALIIKAESKQTKQTSKKIAGARRGKIQNTNKKYKWPN